MLLPYRALLARAGALPLALACALAWLAFTSYGLAIILVVHAATHSFGVAGGAVAAFSAGSALGAPARGRLIDRRGAGSLVLFVGAHACAASALVAACALRAQPPAILGASAVAGAVAPPLIATARSLWADVAGPGLVKPAHALNAGLADAAQLLSPGLTGGLAAAFAPTVALATLIGAASAAGVGVARIGRRRPVAGRRATASRFWGVVTESAGLRTLVACDVAGGLWAGGLEVAVTGLASHHGGAELAAVPLSSAAIGGVLASLWAGSRAALPPASSRYVAGSLVVAAVLPLSAVSPSLASVTCIMVVAGAGYGMLGVSLSELLDDVVAPGSAVEAFTWLTTGQAAGSAAGAAASGALVGGGPALPFVLVASCAAVAAAVAFLRRRTLAWPAPHDS